MIRLAQRSTSDAFERELNRQTSDTRHMTDVTQRTRWRLSRVVGLLAVVIVGIGLAAPAAAQVSGQPPAYTLTPGRAAASTAAVLALIGVVIGGLALTRAASRSAGTVRLRRAVVALVLALIGFVMGAVVVATADGGLGSGSGLAGGVVAMAVGLTGVALGGLALARARRIA